MNWLYVLIDKFGFIAAFDSKEKVQIVIDEWSDSVNLMIVTFPLDDNCQKEEVYFIPYCGLETDCRFPVAFASNNKSRTLVVQKKLLDMDMTYSDNIKFFTKKINRIEAIELARLTDKQSRIRDIITTDLLSKIDDADGELMKLPFDQMIAGLLWDPKDILRFNVEKESENEKVNVEEESKNEKK